MAAAEAPELTARGVATEKRNKKPSALFHIR
jgi:hypothetical protein